MAGKKKRIHFDKGSTFIKEKTGSSMRINLDGQWEHNFADDNTPPEKTPKKK